MARFYLALVVATLPGLSTVTSAARMKYASLVHFTVANPPKDYKGESLQAAPASAAGKKKKAEQGKPKGKTASDSPVEAVKEGMQSFGEAGVGADIIEFAKAKEEQGKRQNHRRGGHARVSNE
eukprot:CAMPEP_0168395310 /NCGR_PEP_ID=MMETSP0228-20121227/19980_1 /TAXON_ID=133427 /ORGANISM="Protoceratium reticulatum, Strain CCCM 535 (=CCMP 1889)" /LENGTH=122 /DNA_ID=CAMNT_0008408743 /DNA_START=59 /DNA_END=427 /DNA_ORIENTATION=+